MDETSPVLIFCLDTRIGGFHEDHEFNLFQIAIKLIFDLKVIQINFSLVNITVDLPLIDDSFVCLGDDCNKIIEQNNYHEHSLEKPDSPC